MILAQENERYTFIVCLSAHHLATKQTEMLWLNSGCSLDQRPAKHSNYLLCVALLKYSSSLRTAVETRTKEPRFFLGQPE